MKGMRWIVPVFVFFLLLSACAFDVVSVKQIPTSLELATVHNNSFELQEKVTVSLGTGFKSTLNPGTKWDYVGKISNGDVFKTKDQVLTVEASNIYEAYIVVASGNLVGFYLPVENTFAPLSKPAVLKTKQIEGNQ